jgi:hypothetical protein
MKCRIIQHKTLPDPEELNQLGQREDFSEDDYFQFLIISLAITIF